MKHYPHCLLCFLDDDFQAELRLAAQHLSPRHERALRVYAQRFQATLDGLGSVGCCPIHVLKDKDGNENEHFTWWVDTILKAIRTSQYKQVFTKLVDAYQASITGRFAESFKAIDDLMKDLEIDKTKSDRLDKILYFRGRKGRFGREDMYHIPFSKRHCISNQRYSVTGQPLLYLGLSILDVAFELGADPLAVDDYSFNTYYVRDPSETRILDLGNSLFNGLWNNIRSVAAAGSKLKTITSEDRIQLPGHKNVVAFYLFIISATCSFRRMSVMPNEAFAPEYVLPQTLAHWAREAQFDGILYTSTRVDSRSWRMSKSLKLNRYRENVAFFTTYDPTCEDDHDFKLLDQFDISPPVRLGEIQDIANEVIDEYRKQVLNDGKSLSLNHLAQRSTVDLDVAFDGLVHLDNKGDETPYGETKCGKLQRYLQFLFLMSRLVEDSK